MIKPPFQYFGGCSSVLSWHNTIIDEIRRDRDIQTWVDVFAGSGIMTINQRPPFPIEVINDKNDLIANVFRMLRDRPEEVMGLLSTTEYSNAVYDEARFIYECDDELTRAWKWIVTLNMVFTGIVQARQQPEDIAKGRTRLTTDKQWRYAVNNSSRGMAGTVSAWLSRIDGLQEVIQRVRQCQISNWDFARVIEKFDTPKTLFYVDPPFVPSARHGTKAYHEEMTLHEHGHLLRLLARCQGAFILRGYRNRLYDFCASRCGWEVQEKECYAPSSHLGKDRDQKKGKPTRMDVVWVRR